MAHTFASPGFGCEPKAKVATLEVYQNNFLDFVYGNPTSTKALGWDEETKARPSKIV